MITSNYIAIIYLTGDLVLICKYCYYIIIYTSKFVFYNFLSRCKGYVIPDVSLFY